MKIVQLQKTFIILLIFLSISAISFGQEPVLEENWIREVAGEYCSGNRYLIYDQNLTREEITTAKQKLKSVKQFAPKDEWEGLYFGNVPVGDEGLLWRAEGGFFRFYCYHELRFLDFGKVNVSLSFVEIVSEKPVVSTSDQKQTVKTEYKLIKVKFGESHYLVPEDSLQDFTARAAGLSTNSDNLPYFYWMKADFR